MSDDIGALVDWQLSRPVGRSDQWACAACYTRWTGEARVCPQCGSAATYIREDEVKR